MKSNQSFLPLIAIFCVSLRASACDDMTVRDSAFQESRDIHRLCVIASGEDPTAMKIFDRLTDWQKEAGKDLNIEVLRLDASDSGGVWKDFG
ncbi:MAG: hypothetical protein MK538_02490, partial [Planctomycetes bacterium]|nr:hypothetical protein [Planctomycetota bacterium]